LTRINGGPDHAAKHPKHKLLSQKAYYLIRGVQPALNFGMKKRLKALVRRVKMLRTDAAARFKS
jgi:hypothetical protein